MNKIDLIIDVLEGYFDDRPLGLDKMHKALAAARELKALKPEQEPVCDKDPFYCLSIRCQAGKVCKHTAPPRKEWVGLTDDEIQDILDCNRGELIAIKKAEQRLKDKNTTHHLQHDK